MSGGGAEGGRRHEGFDDGLEALARSACFREHVRRVHGSPGLRFGMVDADELEVVLSLAGLAPGGRFVDLGCGWGTMTAAIARRTGADGLGLDVATSAIARARTRFPDRPGLDFRVGDLDALDLPAGSLDAAVAADTLYFCRDLVGTLRELHAALAPRGRLVVAHTVSRDARELPDTALGRALAAAGLEVRVAHDASASCRAFWARSVAACLELEEAWRREDPERFDGMLGEARAALAALERGVARRWIVAATPRG